MSPIYSAVAVIEWQGRVLIGERTPGDHAFEGWVFPGGRREDGETPEVTVLRELREETGLTGKVVGKLPDRISYSKTGMYEIKVFKVVLDDHDAPIVCSREHTEFRWVPVREALSQYSLAGNATRSILLDVLHPEAALDWYWPLLGCRPMLPDAVGQFGYKRRFEHHSGVDLYCELGTRIIAVDAGEVIAVENFTGPLSSPPSPWWNPTQAVLIRGKALFVYGEITACVEVGQKVRAGEVIGVVDKPVLKHFKGRPTVMMHFEHLITNADRSVVWPLRKKCPPALCDPTIWLKMAAGSYHVPQFDLSTYKGDKYMDPTALRKPSPWWEVWGGNPD